MTDVPGALRRIAASIRTRLLLTIVVVLTLALGATALVTRQVLLARVDERIQDQLSQEAEELRVFAAEGLDPTTGEPFGVDAARMLTVFLSRQLPAGGEVMVTYLDGQPHRRTAAAVPYRIDTDPALTQRWGTADRTLRGEVDTPAGPFEYLAVPVRTPEGPPAVFLVGQFRELVSGEVDQTVRVTAWVALGSLVLGVALAIGLARRILTPLGRVTRTAEEITDTDLSRRLETHGHDEVARLGATFNGMLDRLEAAFDQQRQFVDDAGHELRTPITVIRGHLELLDDADPHERAATRELVLDELDRMHRMVEDLLVLARAEQPDFVRPAPLDLDDLTTTVHRKATAISPQHDWQLDAVGVGRVIGDQQRLTQALVALADNAAKHTPPGATIGIGSSLEDDRVRLWVRDDGPGIALADRDRIFERFARGGDGPRRSDGAGLGLAIVRAIARAHGGEVTIGEGHGGTDGPGATFTLHLPTTPAEPPDDPGPPPPADPPATRDDHAITQPITVPEAPR